MPATIPPNSAIVDQPRETFWRAFIPALGTQSFVINNLDKETGLINLSYGGDPQQLIDYGQVVSRGYWHTEFPGAVPNRRYSFQDGYGVYWANRQLSLDGRMNVIVQEIDPQKSTITANVRYVVNRRIAIGSGGYIFSNTADSGAFNYGEYGNFGEPHPFSYRANGALEQSFLAIAKCAAAPKLRNSLAMMEQYKEFWIAGQARPGPPDTQYYNPSGDVLYQRPDNSVV